MQNCFGLGGADLVIEIAGTDVEPPSPPRTAQSISRRGPIPVDRFLRPPSGIAGSPLAELAHRWQPTGMVLSLGFDRTNQRQDQPGCSRHSQFVTRCSRGAHVGLEATSSFRVIALAVALPPTRHHDQSAGGLIGTRPAPDAAPKSGTASRSPPRRADWCAMIPGTLNLAAVQALTGGRLLSMTARTKSSTRKWWLPSWPFGAPWNSFGNRDVSCTGAEPEMNASRSSGATCASAGSSGDIVATESTSSDTSVTPCLSCHKLTVASCSKLPSVPNHRNRDSRRCEG